MEYHKQVQDKLGSLFSEDPIRLSPLLMVSTTTPVETGNWARDQIPRRAEKNELHRNAVHQNMAEFPGGVRWLLLDTAHLATILPKTVRKKDDIHWMCTHYPHYPDIVEGEWGDGNPADPTLCRDPFNLFIAQYFVQTVDVIHRLTVKQQAPHSDAVGPKCGETNTSEPRNLTAH